MGIRTSGSWLATAIALCVIPPAHAQLNRAYVSPARGSDANGCSYAQPCRSIDRAISLSNDGGEVVILDSGGLTPFTIDRSISIAAAPGIFAGVIGGNTYQIRLEAPGATVSLHGLSMTGSPSGVYYGIFGPVDTLFLSHLRMEYFSFPIGATAEDLYISNTSIRNSYVALSVSAGVGRVSVRDSFLHTGSTAEVVAASNGAMVYVQNSVVTGGCIGIAASGNSRVVLDSVSVVHNGAGLFVRDGGRFDLADTDIAFNEYSTADWGDGGPIIDSGDNTVRENDHHNSLVPQTEVPFSELNMAQCDAGVARVPGIGK